MTTPGGQCERCGSPRSAGAAEALCPGCLLLLGLSPAVELPGAGSEADEVAAASLGLGAEPPGFGPRGLGDFELGPEIGRGGMGVVYRARQRSANRWVALKRVVVGPMTPASVLDRFRIEVEAAASLDHPSIVAIHEVGQIDGQPFYTMRLVEGPSLAVRLADPGSPLTDREAARLLATVAEAVNHAHQRGVLHRDLKPGNILLDAEGVPQVADFGLARLMGADSSLTLSHAALGTPAYMAPEMAAGAGQATTAADVYSLGAILYEMLTGQCPFGGGTPFEIIQAVVGQEPEKPSQVCAGVDRDLEAICLKCLRKEPGRRYASAWALAQDLGRWLQGEPVQARPAGAFERLWFWSRRKPLPAALAGALLVALLLGGTGMFWQWNRARSTAAREALERQRVETVSFRLELRDAAAAFAAHEGGAGLATLAALLRRNPTNSTVAEWLRTELTFRTWPVPVLGPLAHLEEVHGADFSPDGGRILTVGLDNVARLWDVRTGCRLGSPLAHEPTAVVRERYLGGLKPLRAGFSADGSRVVTASADRTARIWDGHTGEPLTPPLVHPSGVMAAEFSPDGQRIVTAGQDGVARLWAVADGTQAAAVFVHSAAVNFAHFSPDGTRLLTGSDDGTARVWEVGTGQGVGGAMRHRGVVKAGRFSPDGLRVATGSEDGTGQLWDARSGERLGAALRHSGQVTAVCFSPDGGWLATASFDQTVRLWDAFTGAALGRPLEHAGTVRSLQFAPDNRRLLTAGEDQRVRIWDFREGQLVVEPIRHDATVWSARFSPDGQRVVTASADRTCGVWDVRPGAPLVAELPVSSAVRKVRWSPDGQGLLVLSARPMLFVRSPDWSPVRPFFMDGDITGAEFTADGRRVLLSGPQGRPQVRDVASGAVVLQLEHPDETVAAQFSRDGRWILTASGHVTAVLWGADDGRLARSFVHPNPIVGAELRRDGGAVLTACTDGQVRIWDARTGALQVSWPAHSRGLSAVCFSPDGTRVVTASQDFTARIWDAASGRALGPALQHRGAVLSVRFSSGGSRLVTASADNTAQVWQVPGGERVGEPMTHHAAVRVANFDPGDLRVVTASDDRTARVWDAATGEPIGSPLQHGAGVSDARFSPDGCWLATCSGRSARIWPMPRVNRTAPGWLPGLAEAVGGRRRTEGLTDGTVPTTEYLRLRAAFGISGFGDRTDPWLAWFLADRSARPVAPGSSWRSDDCARRQEALAEGGVWLPADRLWQLLALFPSNAVLHAQAARRASLEYETRPVPSLMREADWSSQQALRLAPRNPIARWARAVYLDQAGDSPGALVTLEGDGAHPSDLPVRPWLVLADLRRKAGDLDGAVSAYNQGLRPDPSETPLTSTERRSALLQRSRIHAAQGRVAQAHADHRQAYGVNPPARDPDAPAHLIDLSQFYNGDLEADWRATGFSQHTLASLPRGRQTLDGIEYDVRGLVQLGSGLLRYRGLAFPDKVAGIPVHRPCARVHFLHATDFGMGGLGTVVAYYTLRWADGREERLPIRYGYEALPWDHDSGASRPEAYLAWRGQSPAGLPIWLYRTTWTNPTPAVAVASVDLESTGTWYGQFVVAITTAP